MDGFFLCKIVPRCVYGYNLEYPYRVITTFKIVFHTIWNIHIGQFQHSRLYSTQFGIFISGNSNIQDCIPQSSVKFTPGPFQGFSVPTFLFPCCTSWIFLYTSTPVSLLRWHYRLCWPNLCGVEFELSLDMNIPGCLSQVSFFKANINLPAS